MAKKKSISARVAEILEQKYKDAVKRDLMRPSEAAMSISEAPRLAVQLVRAARKGKMSDEEILKSAARPISELRGTGLGA